MAPGRKLTGVSFLDWLAIERNQQELLTQSLQHLYLTAVPIIIGTLIALLLGVLAFRVARLRPVILNTVSVFLTIPSLALFALMLPIFGIGDISPIIALTLYSLLPITRNTLAGLTSVDPAITDAARGMGMTATARLVRIELPSAWPIILAGLRVATLLIVSIVPITALIGGSGLGQIIVQSGINRVGSPGALEAILGGTLAVIVLALLLDLFYLALGRLTISRGLRD